MTNFIRTAIMASLFAATSIGGVSNVLASERWVGVFIPQQDILVDSFTRNRTEDEYFMPLWGLYEQGRISGGVSNVRVFLWDGNVQTTIYQGIVDGYKYVSVDSESVQYSTYLCVEVDWPIIAHQSLASGDRVMCEKGVKTWFAQGRAKTPEDAWGVIAIKPAGV